MARPRNAIPSENLHLMLPQDLADWLKVYLYSPGEQRIPKGAYTKYFSQLIREHQARLGGNPSVHP